MIPASSSLLPFLKSSKDGVLLDVLVAPRASRSAIIGLYQDRLKIALTAPPLEGRANQALIEYVSQLLQIPKRSISIVSGLTNKKKRLLITDADSIGIADTLHHALS